MKYDIVHEGTVIGVTGNTVEVSMAVEEACGACRAKGLCGLRDQQYKVVGVWDGNAAQYREGDTVIVGIGTAMGMKAVFFAYMLPFLIMLATLLVTDRLGAGELFSGLLTLGAAALYYAVLFFFRRRLERVIVFKIVKR